MALVSIKISPLLSDITSKSTYIWFCIGKLRARVRRKHIGSVGIFYTLGRGAGDTKTRPRHTNATWKHHNWVTMRLLIVSAWWLKQGLTTGQLIPRLRLNTIKKRLRMAVSTLLSIKLLITYRLLMAIRASVVSYFYKLIKVGIRGLRIIWFISKYSRIAKK